MSRITGSEVKSLMEAYSEVYEQKDEIIFEQQPANQSVLSKKTVNGKQIEGSGVGKDFRAGEWSDEAKRRYAQVKSKDTLYGRYQTPDTQKRFDKPQVDEPDASDSNTDDKGQLPPPRPAAPVLSKKGGVEGTGVGKDFKAKSWSDTEKQRYTSASAKVAPTKPAIGTTAGGTKFERRAATGAELRAAQAARKAALVSKPEDKKGAEESAVKAGVETSKPASKPAVTSRPSGFGVPTAPLAAKLSAATSTAPPTPTAAPKAAPLPPKKETSPPPPKTPISSSYEYDAYDLVLEYLLSQGHADTLEEAHYVMMEMDAETIGSIVEGVMPEPIDPIAHNKSQRLATQQGKIRALEGGATTPGEKGAAKSKLKGPQLPGV